MCQCQTNMQQALGGLLEDYCKTKRKLICETSDNITQDLKTLCAFADFCVEVFHVPLPKIIIETMDYIELISPTEGPQE